MFCGVLVCLPALLSILKDLPAPVTCQLTGNTAGEMLKVEPFLCPKLPSKEQCLLPNPLTEVGVIGSQTHLLCHTFWLLPCGRVA